MASESQRKIGIGILTIQLNALLVKSDRIFVILHFPQTNIRQNKSNLPMSQIRNNGMYNCVTLA